MVQNQQRSLDEYFLPDLCNTKAIVVMLLVTEGLVTALTLVDTGLRQFSWQSFALASFFVQWVALVSVAILCQCRRWFSGLSIKTASLFALTITSAVTAVVSVASQIIQSVPFAGIDGYDVATKVVVAIIFTAGALRYFFVQSQWRAQSQAELRSRLSALQANIRPHFFFNSLNTVASLIMIDPNKAEDMLVELAQLFRAVLRGGDQPVALEQEIELSKGYLDIEQTRLGDRMEVHWHLPNPLPNFDVPQLLLQPLLENAVYHGIQPRVEGGNITITLTSEESHWCLKVKNTKPLVSSAAPGNQIAHENIRARLKVHYNGQAHFTVDETQEEYIALMRLPKQETTTA